MNRPGEHTYAGECSYCRPDSPVSAAALTVTRLEHFTFLFFYSERRYKVLLVSCLNQNLSSDNSKVRFYLKNKRVITKRDRLDFISSRSVACS